MANLINGQHPIDFVFDRIRASHEAWVNVADYVLGWDGHGPLPTGQLERICTLTDHALACEYVQKKNAAHAASLAIIPDEGTDPRDCDRDVGIEIESRLAHEAHARILHGGDECPDGCTAGWESDRV